MLNAPRSRGMIYNIVFCCIQFRNIVSNLQKTAILILNYVRDCLRIYCGITFTIYDHRILSNTELCLDEFE